MKGVFFTVVMILFLFALSISLVKWSQGVEIHEARVSKHVYLDSVLTASQMFSDERIENFANISARYAIYKLSNFSGGSQYNKIKQDSSSPRITCSYDENPETCRVSKEIEWLMINGTVDVNDFDSGRSFDPDYTDNELMYTFEHLSNESSVLCESVGWICNLSKPYDVSVRQVSPWDIEINLTLNKTVKDPSGSFSFDNEPVNLSLTIPITGMPDPLSTYIMRDYTGSSDNMRKIYKSEHFNGDNLHWDYVNETATFSKGFFYGPMTSKYKADDIDSSVVSNYIYVGPNKGLYDNGWPDNDVYGAYVLENVKFKETSEPKSVDYTGPGGIDCELSYDLITLEEEKCLFDCFTVKQIDNLEYNDLSCEGYGPDIYEDEEYALDRITNKPYIKILDDDFESISPQPYSSYLYDNEHYSIELGLPISEYYENISSSVKGAGLLIDSDVPLNLTSDPAYTNEYIFNFMYFHSAFTYDIEPLRDMANCGYFIHTDRSPSFFQRMIVGGYKESSDDYGIESFVLGKWAIDDSDYDVQWSNVDYMFYDCKINSVCDGDEGIKMKGMAGCRNQEMCNSNDPNTEGVGHFTLDKDSLDTYYTSLGYESGRAFSCIDDDSDRWGIPCN